MYAKAIVKKGRRDVKPDGRTPIYFTIRESGQPEKLIRPEHFDNETGLPTRAAPNGKLLKNWINNKIEEIERIILELELSGKVATTEAVKERYEMGDVTLVTNFCRQQLANEADRLSKSYQKILNECIDHLEAYKPKATFNEMDKEFLEEYEYYLLNVKKFKKNSKGYSENLL